MNKIPQLFCVYHQDHWLWKQQPIISKTHYFVGVYLLLRDTSFCFGSLIFCSINYILSNSNVLLIVSYTKKGLPT